jgi:ABC-type bacteriocin/lantibiotic exporter with double-glycine peptidase domain
MSARSGLAVGTLLWVACAQLASGTGPPDKVLDGRWQVVRALTFQPQKQDDDCGEATLAMVLRRWGVQFDGLPPHSHGVPASQLRNRARALGLEAHVLPGTFDDLVVELDKGHPIIIGIARTTGLRRFSHFVVVAGHDQQNRQWLVADPDRGWRTLDRQDLERDWSAAGYTMLVVFRPAPLSRVGPAPVSHRLPVCDHRHRTPESPR